MFRPVFVLLAVVSLCVAVSPTVFAADNVRHSTLSGTEEGSMNLSPALAACVGYAGTITEQRRYTYRVTEVVDGPRAGDVHVTGVVQAAFTIQPHTSGEGTIYTGQYREHATFTMTGDQQVISFQFPARATGADGTALRFLLHGHVTVAHGAVKVEFDKLTCVKA